MMRFGLLPVLILLFNACTLIEEKPIDVYELAKMQSLQQQKNWYFDGRLALVNEKDSISASISWHHQVERDDIELSGPLSQGRITISVTADSVVVDDGEKPQEFKGRVDTIVSEQLGVDMPVNALKFWVLGVNDPKQPFTEQVSGFDQGGWLVRFREMQRANTILLPKKISAEKDNTKIKLIIDHWELS